MSYLVDANVLSEPTKPAPDAAVVRWLAKHNDSLIVNPTILGELEYGILALPAGARRTKLVNWFASGVARLRTVDVDQQTASRWAELLAELKRRGRAMPIKDSLIAASARQHGYTIATRNVTDYRYAGVKVVDPFTTR